MLIHQNACWHTNVHSVVILIWQMGLLMCTNIANEWHALRKSIAWMQKAYARNLNPVEKFGSSMSWADCFLQHWLHLSRTASSESIVVKHELLQNAFWTMKSRHIRFLRQWLKSTIWYLMLSACIMWVLLIGHWNVVLCSILHMLCMWHLRREPSVSHAERGWYPMTSLTRIVDCRDQDTGIFVDVHWSARSVIAVVLTFLVRTHLMRQFVLAGDQERAHHAIHILRTYWSMYLWKFASGILGMQ